VAHQELLEKVEHLEVLDQAVPVEHPDQVAHQG
jgi:hypothetical protein